MKCVKSMLSIMIVCIVTACDDPPKTQDGKPDLDWATDHVKEWGKAVKTEFRGMHCAYHSGYAICDVVYTNDTQDQLKCYPQKDDETPRGCFRIEPMKVVE